MDTLDIVERIKKLLAYRGIGDRQMRGEIARTCGISPQAVAQWFNGSTDNIKNEHLASIAKAYGSSLDWLIVGRGPMASGFSDLSGGVGNFEELYGLATPRSRSALEQIASAAAQGALSEADLVMLQQIAQRFMGAATPGNVKNPHDKMRQRLRNDDRDTGAEEL